MYLVFKPTGDKVYLGKRMGWGWYDVHDDIKEKIIALFEIAENGDYEGEQDDFALGMEDPYNEHIEDI